MPSWRNMDRTPENEFIPPKARRLQVEKPQMQTIEEYREEEAKKLEEAKLALSDAAKLKILQKVITTKLDSGTAKAIEKSYEEMLVLFHEVNKLQ